MTPEREMEHVPSHFRRAYPGGERPPGALANASVSIADDSCDPSLPPFDRENPLEGFMDLVAQLRSQFQID